VDAGFVAIKQHHNNTCAPQFSAEEIVFYSVFCEYAICDSLIFGVTNIFSVHEPKILVTASGSSTNKLDDPPNLKKDRCYTKFGGIDRKTST
jgi:hypothetical protein